MLLKKQDRKGKIEGKKRDKLREIDVLKKNKKDTLREIDVLQEIDIGCGR